MQYDLNIIILNHNIQKNVLFHQKKICCQVNSLFILILWLPNLSLFFRSIL